ncbi:DUF2804 domain-containing protein [Ruminococcus sp. CLA-AA-H200]|uniref:DUF2804 domain-containing protein n=1 Tax=Ruminococcus turbiniformis TaxID=2881258 RepID=A0ABS8G1D8_9FIRM|nr:DUF2804 domain-containing protein [Ruminococcus turbiniformis]MCC2254759.1 DUF2804 domain-containing protein [Ruminococcus turbiniformis]
MEWHEVKREQPLLDDSGKIAEPGWARHPVWSYEREQIGASAYRIKERDHYVVTAGEYGAAFTLSDYGYVGIQSVSFFHIGENWEHTETVVTPLPMGKMKMPSSSAAGDSVFRDSRFRLEFCLDAGTRVISCDFKDFCDGKPFYCEITLEEPEMDSIAAAIPGEGKYGFCYDRKICCMRAEGYLSFGGTTYWFDSKRDCGMLDWKRGVFPYESEWRWGAGSAVVGGRPFGFTVSEGSKEENPGIENMIFYEGKGHKIGAVNVHIPEDGSRKAWSLSSGDGRFEMEFQPGTEQKSTLSAAVISTEMHRVIGRMKGRAVLDDGRFIELKDFVCFMEKVCNRG